MDNKLTEEQKQLVEELLDTIHEYNDWSSDWSSSHSIHVHQEYKVKIVKLRHQLGLNEVGV